MRNAAACGRPGHRASRSAGLPLGQREAGANRDERAGEGTPKLGHHPWVFLLSGLGHGLLGARARGREASQPGHEPSVVHPLAAVAGRLSVSGWTAIGLQTENQDRYGGAVSVLVPIDLGQRVSDVSPRRSSFSAVTWRPLVRASQQFTRLR